MTQSLPVVERNLSGWGRCPVVKSYVHSLRAASAVPDVVRTSQNWPVLGRGAGRSYGDAALNSQGYTLSSQPLDQILAFNPETGILRCQAGVTFAQINRTFVPQGWFPAVTPGTQFPTMGGAVAFDVHGKNHHRDGSFSQHLCSLKLVLPSGETAYCSRHENSDLFWATVGGMGLTGIITEVELTLHPIETAYIQSYRVKARNLDEAIALFAAHESQYQYSVAWLDCLATGQSLGRSVLTFGNHAGLNDLSPAQRAKPLQVQPKQRLRIPFDLPASLLNRFTVGGFNTLYYHLQPNHPKRSVVDYESFFYPLDTLWDWNRLYGRRGFIQYQFVVPPATSRAAIAQILQLFSQKGWGSFLTVLKKLGPETGWLSFPMPGYTLALDIPVRRGLWRFLEQIDQVVIQHGGRVYLAKDARLGPEAFRAMYPNWSQWSKVKAAVDPTQRFSSELSRRLKIGQRYL
ncbi:MAG: FAD-binding oxidoreductase [Leptolyngbya sp. SIO4C5]|nr:FAD-binding oxidoreductase [Leptolyngbya sp. SIO4C5]